MKRSFLSLAGAALLTGALLVQPAAAFSADPAAWAAESVDYLEANGIYQGVDLSQTSPRDTIGRGAFCQLLVNVIQAELTEEEAAAVPPLDPSYFPDLSQTVTQASPGGAYDMYYAAAYGLTEGATDGSGRRVADAQGLLTREQAAKMMCALVEFLEERTGEVLYPAGTARTYSDAGAVSPWARPWVEMASARGILQGDETGRFLPAGTLTWEEASVMAQRALSAARVAAGTESPQDQPGQAGLPEGVLALDTQLERSSLQELLQTVMPNAAGGFDVVDHTSPVRVESFDWTGASTGMRTLPAELEDLGPMLQTEDAIYIAYGQSNPQEDDGREVYRVVKYSRTWERLGAASITGGESYTTQPFRASTHGALAEEDGTLVLHTGRLRYQSSDGLNHQSNFTAKIDTSTMTVLETSSQFPDNHVSHSFAQYVLFDDGQVVYADHGDAYPRSFVLTVEGDFGSWQSCAQQDLLTFYGAIGDNTTNARPGGLGISETHYLFLGASAPQAGPGESYRDENVFLAAVPKDQFPHGEVELQWLTQLPAGQEWVERAVLVPLNNDTFLAMWETGAQEGEGSFSYAVFDGTGRQVGQTQTKEGFRAPDQITDPAVLEDTVLWTQEPLPQENEGGRGLRLYQLQVPLNAETAPAEEHTISLAEGPRQVALGETLQLTAQTTPASGPAVSWSSSDPWTASVSQTGLVAPRREGTVTITASAVYRGRTKTASCTVEVVPAAPELSLRLDAYARALEVGETFRLTAQTQPASGAAVSWRSSDPAVAAVSGGEVTARAPGRAEITATASYRGQTQTATCLVQVLEPEETQQPEEPPEEQPEEQPEQEQPGQDTGEAQRPGGTGQGDAAQSDRWPVLSSQAQAGLTDVYQEDYSNGDFLRVEVTAPDQITLSGRYTIPAQAAGLYNYAVLRVAGGGPENRAEIPYTSGAYFEGTAQVDMEVLRAFKAEKPEGRSHISVMICQNYHPGDSAMGGIGLQGADLILELDEDGDCTLLVEPRD